MGTDYFADQAARYDASCPPMEEAETVELPSTR